MALPRTPSRTRSKKKNSRSLTCYIFKSYLFFLRDTAVSAFDFFCLSVYARRSLGRIFAVAQMRTTAKHSFAAYSLEDSLQKENSRSLTCYIFKSYLFFYEIRPFPPSILFICPYMRGGASAGFSLSLKCERRQSHALPRTRSRTRSKKKTAGL